MLVTLPFPIPTELVSRRAAKFSSGVTSSWCFSRTPFPPPKSAPTCPRSYIPSRDNHGVRSQCKIIVARTGCRLPPFVVLFFFFLQCIPFPLRWRAAPSSWTATISPPATVATRFFSFLQDYVIEFLSSSFPRNTPNLPSFFRPLLCSTVRHLYGTDLPLYAESYPAPRPFFPQNTPTLVRVEVLLSPPSTRPRTTTLFSFHQFVFRMSSVMTSNTHYPPQSLFPVHSLLSFSFRGLRELHPSESNLHPPE